MNHPLVSISCITYNHTPYIRECLDGFLMQKCDFDFEVLIHDDASTDGTQEIIREYQEKYPEIIKPILQKENQWSQGVRGINLKFNFSRAKGKYIALCEGDDYWTDPLKLQKQVDFLEENEEYVACGCYVNVERFGVLETRTKFINIISDTKEILIENPFPTLTSLFRNVNFNDFKKYNAIVGDIELFLYLSRYGNFMKLDFLGGVYRFHGNGANSGNDYYTNVKNKILAKIKFNNFYKLCLNRQIDIIINNYIKIEIYKIRYFYKRNYSIIKSYSFIKYCFEMKRLNNAD